MHQLSRYKFSELYGMSSGISSKPEQAGHGFPFVSFSTVFNNQFLPDTLPDLMDSSEEEREKYSVKEGDIFLTRTSETLDELAMSSVVVNDMPDATYSGFLKRLRPTQTSISYHKFMAFYLRSKLFRKTMDNNAIMTLRASLNEQIFSYLDLLLPEYKEQKRIGDYLYMLSKKIDFNNRINIELESMAKLIYDYWFVQFDFPDSNGMPYKSSGGKMVYNKKLKRKIPEGWLVDRVSKKISICSGHPFNSKNYDKNGKYKIITIKNVQDGHLDTSEVNSINHIPEAINNFCFLEKGDVLISLTGNVGRVCYVDENNLLLNQRVGKLVADKEFINFGYLFFSRPENKKKLEQISGGSSQSNLSPIDAVKDYFAIPNESILDDFNKTVCPIINKLINNKVENQKLKELQDWLFPMLLYGKIAFESPT